MSENNKMGMGDNNHSMMGERVTRVEERLTELKKQFEEHREEIMQALKDQPKRAAWWIEKSITILLGIGALIGMLHMFHAPEAAAAAPMSPEMVRQIAEETAKAMVAAKPVKERSP